MANNLTAEERRRLGTWAVSIVAALRPDAPMADTSEGVAFGNNGSLKLTSGEGWFDHEAGKGGKGTLNLIQHLLGGTAAEASAWAGNWLAAHEGMGPAIEEIILEAKEALAKYTANEIRRILVEMIDPIGTPAETYLRARGLVPPYPDCLKYLDNGRTGESAVVGVLTTADGETVGAQLLYIDPQGRKSVVKPQRKVFYSGGCARDQSAFRITVSVPSEQIPTEVAPPLVLAEGLEDALSVAQAGAAREVWGFPGVGCFPKLKLSAGAAVVLFRDGDTEETKSEAVVAVAKAVNQWLLAKVKVRVVETPDGEDANSLLGSKGPEELRRLVAEAPAGVLDWDGEVVRLGSLNPTQYERERAAAAKRHGFGVGAVDRLVKDERARAKAAGDAADPAEAAYPHPIKRPRGCPRRGARGNAALRGGLRA